MRSIWKLWLLSSELSPKLCWLRQKSKIIGWSWVHLALIDSYNRQPPGAKSVPRTVPTATNRPDQPGPTPPPDRNVPHFPQLSPPSVFLPPPPADSSPVRPSRRESLRHQIPRADVIGSDKERLFDLIRHYAHIRLAIIHHDETASWLVPKMRGCQIGLCCQIRLAIDVMLRMCIDRTPQQQRGAELDKLVYVDHWFWSSGAGGEGSRSDGVQKGGDTLNPTPRESATPVMSRTSSMAGHWWAGEEQGARGERAEPFHFSATNCLFAVRIRLPSQFASSRLPVATGSSSSSSSPDSEGDKEEERRREEEGKERRREAPRLADQSGPPPAPLNLSFSSSLPFHLSLFLWWISVRWEQFAERARVRGDDWGRAGNKGGERVGRDCGSEDDANPFNATDINSPLVGRKVVFPSWTSFLRGD
ncbi:hypothetical protein BDK51DRAFT_30298 [Blyttiomyces helicus]|uniref:Uncharacterized protein n=1 Tax=Blyttiomyces helicus TaxID=388810 RepID=A0A4P9WK46_9FUNG|nr:hypothetical protein BDK51DRAFT_30298 [Blyttiomyces helicus]|eukprot:RKO92465.1 hypothetical protein BDK51DRAFT_30298 [Blyttiomyces helicus]